MKVITLRVKNLQPYDRNAKLHPKAQIDRLADSIQQFGFNNPVLIDSSNQIIAGHGRVLAAKQLKLKELPCVVLDHLTDEQKRAYMLADNRIAEQGGWDDDLLSLELNDLKAMGMDLTLTGFTDEDWQKLLPEKLDTSGPRDDQVPPLPEPENTVCKSGDIWLLGEHRLMCGDSTNSDDMKRLTNGHPVDLVWTDPPYNVNYQGSTEERLTIANDNLDSEAFLVFMANLFANCQMVARPGCPIYVAYADSESDAFRTGLVKGGWKLSQTLIWVKQHFKLSRQDYHWRHEPIIYGWKPGKPHPWYGGRKQSTVMDEHLVLDNMPHDELLKLAKSWQQVINGSVIKCKKSVASHEHPTMKPVALVLTMLLNSSKAGDWVLDPCGGSGTTLIAAEKSHRRACLMEIDPRYCDVIIQRWQDYTGQKAINNTDNKEVS